MIEPDERDANAHRAPKIIFGAAIPCVPASALSGYYHSVVFPHFVGRIVLNIVSPAKPPLLKRDVSSSFIFHLNDIDMIVVLPEDYDFTAKRPPFQYNVSSRRQVRRQHKFDIIPVQENSAAHRDALTFFQQVREQQDVRKGLLRIAL